jgi:hypothetical protein
MQQTEKRLRIIRTKLRSIGISEQALDDETILSRYSLNSCGGLCAAPRDEGSISPVQPPTS